MPTSEVSESPRNVRKEAQGLIEESIISFHSQLPIPLKNAMNDFIETHPNWDQYRLIQAALAGFLVQNGISSREITRLYVGNMFDSNSLLKGN